MACVAIAWCCGVASNLFFGCSTYSKCQYTRELREGLAIYGRAREQQPVSLGEAHLEAFDPRAEELVFAALCRPSRMMNSPNEPRLPHFCRTENSYAAQGITKTGVEDEHHRLQPDNHDNEINESLVALLDTACTSCIHSRRWREAYSRSLPAGAICEMTPARKHFHFANGQSTEQKLIVWKIPIYLGGCRGEVHSAEVDTGTTPLLLSIPTMDRA